MKTVYPLILLPLLLLLAFVAQAAYNEGARYAFVPSVKQQNITIIDLEKHKLAKSIKLPEKPGGIAASDGMNMLIVAHPENQHLTLIDLANESLLQYDYKLSIRPDHIQLSQQDYNLAIYDRQSRIIEVHSLYRGASLARIENAESGELLTFSYDGSKLYWIDRQSGELKVIDLLRNRVTDKLALTEPGNELSALTRSIDGTLGFISDAQAGKVYVVDLQTMQKLSEIAVGKSPGRPWGTADGRMMLVANRDGGSVTTFSTITLQAEQTFKVMKAPLSLNTGWLDTVAAVTGENNELIFIDLLHGKINARLKLPGTPDEGVVTSNSRTLALSLAGPGMIALFDMKSQQLIEAISGLPADSKSIALSISNNYCH